MSGFGWILCKYPINSDSNNMPLEVIGSTTGAALAYSIPLKIGDTRSVFNPRRFQIQQPGISVPFYSDLLARHLAVWAGAAMVCLVVNICWQMWEIDR